MSPIKFPQMVRVRQRLYASPLTDVKGAVAAALGSCPEIRKAGKGARIALAVGSRGIDAIDRITAACAAFFKRIGCSPFIVPAMGSHGGATPEGQEKILAGLGITAAAIGVPVRSDMATAAVGRLSCGMNIFVAREALDADLIFPVNRIKPHTKYIGDIESGLAKMLAVGLGKADGAREIHRFAVVTRTFDVIRQAAEQIIATGRVLGGLAILEDGRGRISRVEALPAAGLIEEEKKLLAEAYRNMARIPFDNVDLLVVDRIGKDISGIGMDSNVTGRHRDITGDFFTAPHARRIFVRDLSPASDGNANGIGLADFTTTRLVNAIDRKKTLVNALAAISPEKAAIPVAFDSDREAIVAAAQSCGLVSPESARIIRIQDTRHLETLAVSRVFEKEILEIEGLSLDGTWAEMAFDEQGNLINGCE
ncbi:MAG: DUF362 domain-containing protein [Thermodesulfobacteriota bacterium]